MIDNSASGMTYNRFSNLDGIEDRVIRYLLYYDNKTEEEKKLVTRIRRILLYNDQNALLSIGENGYPDPDDRDKTTINITDKTKPDYYCGLAKVPKKQGLSPFPGTETVTIMSDESPIEYIWVLARYAIAYLIFNDCNYSEQANKRVFRSPRIEDVFDAQCTLLKIYVDSIIPTDHLNSVVNVGVDVVVNTKIINVNVSEQETNTYIYEAINSLGEPYIVPVQTKSRVSTMTQAILSLLNGASIQGIGRMIFSRDISIFNKAQYGIWNNRNFEGMKIVIGTYMSGVS